jgi:nucleoside-diphosphate-sugar epimerase
VAGARVNVQGTASMFELVRRLEIGNIVYASSAAVYGPKALYDTEIVDADAQLHPTSHYGAYKVANEHQAQVWFESVGISSVGLRPHSVYGPGRDQGVTSKPTLAMIAAAAHRPYQVDFGGRYQFQFAADVARAFVAAAQSDLSGAHVFSIPGALIGLDDIVTAIAMAVPESTGTITHTDRVLPFPSGFDGTPFENSIGAYSATPLGDGVLQTVETYRAALANGRLDAAYLDRVLSS